MSKPIRVVIDEAKFYSAAKRHDVHMNISVIKALKDAGIPAIGGIELRGVEYGRLTFEREVPTKNYIFTWEPGIKPQPAPVQVKPFDEDDDDL